MKTLRAPEMRVSILLQVSYPGISRAFKGRIRENPEKASPMVQPMRRQQSLLTKLYPDMYCCVPCEINILLYRKREASVVALGNCWKPTAAVREELENKGNSTFRESRNTC